MTKPLPFEPPAPGEEEYLEKLLGRAVSPPSYETIAAIEASPFDPGLALGRNEADRLCDPSPLPVETGWTRLEDMSVQIAVETPMPELNPEMVEWWFDWHPRRPDRYRVWHPIAHFSNGFVPAEAPAPKPSWGVNNFPDEDVGDGRIRIRAEFCSPRDFGFAGDYLESEDVGTIICARVGDRWIRHTGMAHVFLRDGDGLRLRSRFWIGSRVSPRLPGPISFAEGALESLASRKVVRNLAIPDRVGHGLALHCAEEYAHLNAILPGLFERFSR